MEVVRHADIEILAAYDERSQVILVQINATYTGGIVKANIGLGAI